MLKKNFQLKKVKIILNIVAILLFSLNYQICEFFYPEDISKWWALKMNMYAVIIALVFTAQSLDSKGWLRFVLYIGVGFAISSVIDKLFLDVRVFTVGDLLMIVVTVILASINFIKERLNG